MGRMEEGVELRDETLEVIDYLQDVLQKLDAGLENHILGDPFYQRADGKDPFTDEQIDRVINAIDAEFAIEISLYPGYHKGRSGANTTPDFWRLSPSARRVVVERLDAIHRCYREVSAESEPRAA